MNQVGRYQILEELGRGAMGVVYKALDPAIGRTVAIKTIRLSELTNPDERQRVRDRLLREAQSAGLLSHPNIVTIYDVLEREDYAYIFMEYVNGASLEKMLRARALPENAALLHFLRQVAEALDYAHRKGIVHRDIKPANIIISEGGQGVERMAKIADFGVAKFVSHEMTHSGTMIGTPNYMPPEQIQGTTVDGHSDQFSLAVVVYELLSGEKPFTSDNLPALFYLICKQDPKPIGQVNPTLSEAVDRVLQRALAKEPAQRFPSCGDFIGALIVALGECPNWALIPRAGTIAGANALEATAMEAGKRPNGQGITRKRNGAGSELSEASVASAVETVHNAPIISIPDRPYDLPPLSRRRRGDDEFDAPDQRSSFGKKLGLILAMCFAIGAAIVFIVKWNSGPAVPVQVLDVKSSPVTPPPDMPKPAKQEPKPNVQNTSPATSAPPPHTAESKSSQNAAPTEKQPPNQGGQAAPALPGGTAEVDFLSQPPGAKIVVDAREETACNAPCTLSLPAGRHTLSAELKGYNVARRIFSVPEDESLFIALNRSMGVLLVSSAPNGCTITVDGQRFGQTPATLHLPVGAHRVAVGNGAKIHEETVEIQSDGFDARRFPCQQ